MSKPRILHMLTPTSNISPFDANMAIDAGWEHTPQYLSVGPDDVEGLVQDMIFSRSPSGLKSTGAFIGGRDVFVAAEMLKRAREVMFPPFEISLFTDPSGAATTAAGMVAYTRHLLKSKFNADWKGMRVLTVGGTGPVGVIASMLAAKAGAEVTLLSRSAERAATAAGRCSEMAGVTIAGGDDKTKSEQLAETDIVFATAAAGVVALNADELAKAKSLKLAVDINSVPPSGIEGVNAQDDCVAVKHSESGALGVGALVVGDVKYNTQHRMFKRMLESDKPVCLGFDDAVAVAEEHLASKK